MTGVVEACCAGTAETAVTKGLQSAAKSGNEAQDLFAALLLALSCCGVVPEAEAQASAAAQATEGNVTPEGIEAIADTSIPSGQTTPVCAEQARTVAVLLPEATYSAESEYPTLPVLPLPASPIDAADSLVGVVGGAALSEAPKTETPAAGVETVHAATVDVAAADVPVADLAAKVLTLEEIAFPQPDRAQPVNAYENKLQETAGEAKESAFLAKLDIVSASAEPELLSNASPEPEQPSPAAKPNPESLASGATNETMTPAFPGEAPDVKVAAPPPESTQGSQTKPVPSSSANTQPHPKAVSAERILAETGTKMEQNGDKLSRGAGERAFQQGLLHSHEVRVQGITNTSDNVFARVTDVARVQFTQSVVDQTVRSVLLSARNGVSELRVRLKPEHLGELLLRLVVKDNVLQLNLNTQSTLVKSIIESNLGQLRQSLEGNGFDTGKLSVTVDPNLNSGGHASRQAHGFQPSPDDWLATYDGGRAGEEPPSEGWPRSARVRHATGRIDLIA